MSLSPDELVELRAAFASLGVAPDAIDKQIRILDNIAKSWAEQSFGFSSIKLTLSQRANYSLAGVDVCDKIEKSRTVGRIIRSSAELPDKPDSKGPVEP